MNKDSEKIFENYLAAGMISGDPVEEEAPQAPAAGGQPGAQQPAQGQQQPAQPAQGQQQAAADPGAQLAELVAADPKVLAELSQLPEVQGWIQQRAGQQPAQGQQQPAQPAAQQPAQ